MSLKYAEYSLTVNREIGKHDEATAADHIILSLSHHHVPRPHTHTVATLEI